MKARYWSLAVVLVLINYLIFATLFTRLLETDFGKNRVVHTPIPTFTPAPAEPIAIVPTPVPVLPEPSPTATRVLIAPESNAGGADLAPDASQPVSAPVNQAQLIAPGPVNIRSGPGIDHPVIGTLNPNTVMPIVGRNSDASWWQIEITNGTMGWVSNAVVNASNTSAVPLVELVSSSSPPPVSAQPAASKSPAAPPQSHYQYEPTGWWDNGSPGPTRFSGEIKDANGNPVNGAFLQASCGDYSTISYPSGPVGWGGYNVSADWSPGFYDLTVDNKPVPCLWILTVVDTDDREHVKATLSESVPVEVTLEKSSIVANWRKNW